MPRSDRLITTAGMAVMAVGFAGLLWVDARHDTLRSGVVDTTIVWFGVAFAGYALVMAQQRAGSARLAKNDWRVLLGLGLALRLVLLLTEPSLSDDVYRYLWEGHLVSEGVSPYRYIITDPALNPYEIGVRSMVNNTTLASPYLPFAHVIFGLAALVLPASPWVMQLVMVAFDVLAVAMIIRLLDVAGLPRRRALLYWLNPLVIIEVAHGAHLDAIIVGLSATALWLTLARAPASFVGLRAVAAPLSLAMATLTRPIAVLLLPVLYWLWTWRQRVIWLVAVAVPIVVTGAWVGFGLGDGGTGLFGSARAYVDDFRFNSGLYHWLERWVGSQGLDDRGWDEPVALTRTIVTVVVTVAMLVVFARARSVTQPREALRLMVVPVAIYVLATPVLHPWYVLSLLALVPFVAPGSDDAAWRWLDTLPWLALSGLLIFSYLTYEDPSAFAERSWVRQLEWFPTLALLGIAVIFRLAGFYRTSGARHREDSLEVA